MLFLSPLWVPIRQSLCCPFRTEEQSFSLFRGRQIASFSQPASSQTSLQCSLFKIHTTGLNFFEKSNYLWKNIFWTRKEFIIVLKVEVKKMWDARNQAKKISFGFLFSVLLLLLILLLLYGYILL